MVSLHIYFKRELVMVKIWFLERYRSVFFLCAAAFLAAPAIAFSKDDVQRCFEGCNARFREMSAPCDDDVANCTACGGVWVKHTLVYEPSGYFCAAFGGGIWPPPQVDQEELDACLAAISLACNANAQAEYRACTAGCRRLRQPGTFVND